MSEHNCLLCNLPFNGAVQQGYYKGVHHDCADKAIRSMALKGDLQYPKLETIERDSLRTRVSSQDETIERISRELAEAVALLSDVRDGTDHNLERVCAFLARIDGASDGKAGV